MKNEQAAVNDSYKKEKQEVGELCIVNLCWATQNWESWRQSISLP